VLQAPKIGRAFRLYVEASERVLGTMLTQDVAGKEGVIAYLSRRVVDMETRYTHVERLCLALYYACSKLWQYLLSSPCTVLSQYDVVKHMMHMPILSGCLGKWAYSLIEYELSYKPLRAMKGQVGSETTIYVWSPQRHGGYSLMFLFARGEQSGVCVGSTRRRSTECWLFD
jgi:hypothetical protein